MSEYKRATAKLQAAGITDIVIKRGAYGPWPAHPAARRQTSKTFKTWQLAVQAVLDGYRPTIEEEPK